MVEAAVILVTVLPKCCPICGWPFELTPSQAAEFERFKVAFCVNGGHLFQKITVEAALAAAEMVGSDLPQYLKSDP